MSPPPIPIIRTRTELSAVLQAWRTEGARVGLVPTMGALHQGHLALVRAAKADNQRVLASIFVNPAQFAPHEDFDRYPRDLEGDTAKLANAGCDMVYAPGLADIYPDGFAVRIEIAGPALGLESDFRPHFFSGVATIVAKLLIQVTPQAAYFGEKDYQQLLVVKRLASDLDLGVEIVGYETVREPDGLALSSRNAYLKSDQRAVAAALNVALRNAATEWRNGAEPNKAENAAAQSLLSSGFTSVDYIALRHAHTLQALTSRAEPARVLGAAWLGETRLIDNLPA